VYGTDLWDVGRRGKMLILILMAMKYINSYDEIQAASRATDCKIWGPNRNSVWDARGAAGLHATTITKLNFQPKVQVRASERPSDLRSKKSETTLLQWRGQPQMFFHRRLPYRCTLCALSELNMFWHLLADSSSQT
jgi:hypothetical protein